MTNIKKISFKFNLHTSKYTRYRVVYFPVRIANKQNITQTYLYEVKGEFELVGSVEMEDLRCSIVGVPVCVGTMVAAGVAVVSEAITAF